MPAHIKPTLKRFGATTMLIWTVLIGTLLAIRINDHNNEFINDATTEARDYFRLNLHYRAWAAKMGGVYVPADKAVPNPYLQVPNRDITTSDNRQLTLINPAYMTRMVFEDILAASPEPIINKITSLKPLNPVNAPDEWERQSLTAFDRKEYSERSEAAEISGKPYLRFISAFTTNEACLKCHAHQGYKVGDVRGAIVISVPLSKRLELHSQTNRNIIAAYGFLWLVGSIGIAFAANRRSRDEEMLQAGKERLQQQNEDLQVNEEELRCQNDELISAEAMLRENKEKYRLLVDNLASGVVVHALDSSVAFANPAALSLLGLSKEQIKGKTAIDPAWCFLRENGSVMPLDEYPVNQVLSSGTSLSDFIVGVRRPELFNPVWVSCHAYPSRDAEGQLQQVVVTFSDISRLKQADEALNKRLVTLTQPIDCGSVAFGELFNINDVQRLQDEFAKATGVASIITDPDGIPLTTPSNFTRLCNDIIRKSEKGCANCFKSDAALGRFNPDGPTIQTCLSGGLWDAGAGITVGGQHIANWLIGQVRDESQTEETIAAYAREISVDEASFMAAFREVPSMAHTQFKQIAKTLFTLATQLSTTAYQNIQQARFINERKQSEEQLQSLTQRLQLATSSAQLGIWDWNVSENTMFWDDRMFELYGTTREIFPNSVDAWINGLHPEDKDTAIAASQAALNGEKEFDTEFRILHPDGTVKHIRGKGLVLRGAGGSAERMLGINYDVTKVKHAEEEKHKLEAQLQQAQKMESVGRLAGGVAHDFNNMLSVIMGHAELGLMHLDPTHRVCADLKEISKTAERSADLTRQLLAFARKQTVMPKVIDLNDTITSMFKMLQRLIGEDIHLTWQPSSELCQVKMDPTQIDQILANLCVNARDAIEDTGRVSIETGTCTIDVDYCAANPEATPGEYVRLVVSDSGKGMDRETQSHIFEPFYTTKELGKGTGLGLATVYGAVKQNNGFINIYSEPGNGTTFSIYLLRETNMGTARRSHTDAETTVPCGQETILLTEDEAAILNIASLMLEKQGYSVLKAATPGEALRLAREHVGEIHLLMTDVIMPEMNGRDLAKNVQLLYPQIKRLFMSGYTADVIAHHGVLEEGVHFIQKPFSLPNMAAMVREVLDGNS